MWILGIYIDSGDSRSLGISCCYERRMSWIHHNRNTITLIIPGKVVWIIHFKPWKWLRRGWQALWNAQIWSEKWLIRTHYQITYLHPRWLPTSQLWIIWKTPMASPTLRPPSAKSRILRRLEQLRYNGNRLRQLCGHVLVSNQMAGSNHIPEDVGSCPLADPNRQQLMAWIQTSCLPSNK